MSRAKKAEGKPAVLPACPSCRESDQVSLPTDSEIARKVAYRLEPYCMRCHNYFSRLKPHRLPPPEFD